MNLNRPRADEESSAGPTTEKHNRACGHVFISSTFRDLHAEREALAALIADRLEEVDRVIHLVGAGPASLPLRTVESPSHVSRLGVPRRMQLRQLVQPLPSTVVEGPVDREVVGITYDSRRVTPGMAFIAIPGHNADGHEFIDSAIARGAAAVICERTRIVMPRATPIRVTGVREGMACTARSYYQHPSAKLKVIGVTGTNGKTTVALMIKALLEAVGHRSGVRYETGDCVIPDLITDRKEERGEEFRTLRAEEQKRLDIGGGVSGAGARGRDATFNGYLVPPPGRRKPSPEEDSVLLGADHGTTARAAVNCMFPVKEERQLVDEVETASDGWPVTVPVASPRDIALALGSVGVDILFDPSDEESVCGLNVERAGRLFGWSAARSLLAALAPSHERSVTVTLPDTGAIGRTTWVISPDGEPKLLGQAGTERSRWLAVNASHPAESPCAVERYLRHRDLVSVAGSSAGVVTPGRPAAADLYRWMHALPAVLDEAQDDGRHEQLHEVHALWVAPRCSAAAERRLSPPLTPRTGKQAFGSPTVARGLRRISIVLPFQRASEADVASEALALDCLLNHFGSLCRSDSSPSLPFSASDAGASHRNLGRCLDALLHACALALPGAATAAPWMPGLKRYAPNKSSALRFLERSKREVLAFFGANGANAARRPRSTSCWPLLAIAPRRRRRACPPKAAVGSYPTYPARKSFSRKAIAYLIPRPSCEGPATGLPYAHGSSQKIYLTPRPPCFATVFGPGHTKQTHERKAGIMKPQWSESVVRHADNALKARRRGRRRLAEPVGERERILSIRAPEDIWTAMEAALQEGQTRSDFVLEAIRRSLEQPVARGGHQETH